MKGVIKLISRQELINRYGKDFWSSLSDQERAWIEGSNGLPVNGRLPTDLNRRQKIKETVAKKLAEEGIKNSKKGRI